MSLVPEEAVPRGDSHYLAVSLCPASHLLCQEGRVYKPEPNSVSSQCTQIKGGARLGTCKPERNTSLTDAAAPPAKYSFLPWWTHKYPLETQTLLARGKKKQFMFLGFSLLTARAPEALGSGSVRSTRGGAGGRH